MPSQAINLVGSEFEQAKLEQILHFDPSQEAGGFGGRRPPSVYYTLRRRKELKGRGAKGVVA